METKKVIRKQTLFRRNSLTPEERQQYSKIIAEKLYHTSQYKKAKVVLLYLSYQSEVDTLPIVRQCLREEKEVYCPKVLANGVMEFYRIYSLKDVKEGYQGILEPVTMEVFQYMPAISTSIQHKADKSSTSSISLAVHVGDMEKENSSVLMIMPLTVFDSHKNRIGYGKGFYDRYLQGKEQIATIALAYEEQKWEGTIPTDIYDIKPDIILTQNMKY